tara:strand:+ start:231 stop:413 length:183 start_codon:yes stop_codon:yes gene_type:complete
MRKYKVEIQIAKTKIYHIEAEDDADIVAKFNNNEITDKGELIKTIEADVAMGSWELMKNE